MPTYQYACTECGAQMEVVQSFSDDALTVCPECEGRLRKVYSAVGIVFKGSGFYRTDSGKTSNSSTMAGSGASTAPAADSGSAKPSSGSDTSSTSSSSSPAKSESTSGSTAKTAATGG